MLVMEVEGRMLSVLTEENPSAKAFEKMVLKQPLTVEMRDFVHIQKCGTLKEALPSCACYCTAKPGDLVLRKGNQLILYYGENTWYFTKIGRVTNLSSKAFETILKKDFFTATFSFQEEITEE